jgi:hypothetical protein
MQFYANKLNNMYEMGKSITQEITRRSGDRGRGVQTGRLMSGEAQRSQLPLAGVAQQGHMAGDLLHNLSLSRMDGELGLPAE